MTDQIPFEWYSDADRFALMEQVGQLLTQYRSGALGGSEMPEDAAPMIADSDQRALFFTLPMALNYQRNSYALWRAASSAFLDEETRWVFDPSEVVRRSSQELTSALIHHRVALQPNRHPAIWLKICNELVTYFDSSILTIVNSDPCSVAGIAEVIQVEHKKGFPYLSGRKIFNYWLYVIEQRCDVKFVDRQLISVAPDTHVVQSSVHLGLAGLEGKQGPALQDAVTRSWVELLVGSDLAPIDVHSALWLWSRAGFPTLDGNPQSVAH